MGANQSTTTVSNTTPYASCATPPPSTPQQTHTGVSIAPAGHKYKSIEHAGECILYQNCEGYPNNKSSHILPPLFHKHYPEAVDKTTSQITRSTRTLTTKEENKFFGIRSNQSGEDAEYAVFRAFEELLYAEEQQEPLLILRNFCMDTDNSKNVKRLELINQLASINLTNVPTRDERDFVVLVENLGVVLLEVKTSSTMLSKAEQQLENGQKFVCALMDAITGAPSLVLPCVKVVIVPNELAPSPKNTQACHVVYNDQLNNFKTKWTEILNELRKLAAINVIGSSDYTRLTRFMVGLWSMKVMYRSHNFDFDDTEASLLHQLKVVDDEIDHGHLSSDVKKEKSEKRKENPVTDVVYNKLGVVFRVTCDISLVHLTPSQKDVYDNYLQVIIRGHAGTGKTLLILFKIIEIMKNNPNEKILLIAPNPHHVRCRNILASNNVPSKIYKSLPDNITSEVVVMQLKDFFNVTREQLSLCDVSDYHIFIDDFQSHQCKEGFATFEDILQFIDNTYIASQNSHLYLWCLLDLVQAEYFGDKSNDDPSVFLYDEIKGKPRTFSTPIYILEDILRNSREITQCIMDARTRKVSAKRKNASKTIGNVQCGHNISSLPVTCHVLCMGTERKYYERFVVDRVKEELEVILSGSHALKPSHIAILYGGYGRRGKCNTVNAVQEMVKNAFQLNTQTIEQQLLTHNDHDMVCDDAENAMSFEAQCVICVDDIFNSKARLIYNMFSRARTRLMFIQPFVTKTTYTPKHCNVITWKYLNGDFIKM